MFTKHYLHHESHNADFQQWLEQRFWPLMGREEGDDEEGNPGEAGEGEEGGDGEEAPAGGGDGGDGDEGEEPEGSGGGDEGDDSPAVKLTKELAQVKAQLNAAEKAVQKAKKEARDARSKAASDSGNWEAVAKERESELADANERVTKAEKRAEDAEGSLDKFQRTVRVTSIAQRLGYRDPLDAIALLKEDDTGDDKSAERALRKLAETKDYLVDQRRASGRGMSGGNGATGLFTKEQLDNMTPEQINANWEKVQASMAAQ